MSQSERRLRRGRARTWSAFGDLGRKPSEYEVVTHNMNHTYGGEGEPLEMGANVPGNVWLRRHRDPHLFGVEAWDKFRDPDELTYRKYCEHQDEQETYVDGLLKDFSDVKRCDGRLSDNALQFLQLAWTPGRYLAHGQQMLIAYIQQLAPSTYVGNCATFQTADALRRVERIAYRTRQLDRAHPVRGFASNEREIWERDADWQPIRRAIEQALVKYDFDDAFVSYQLVLRPILDDVLLRQFAVTAGSLGDDLDALIADNLYLDSVRADSWCVEMVRFMTAENPDSRARIKELIAANADVAGQVLEAGAALLARHATPATVQAFGQHGDDRPAKELVGATVRERVRANWRSLLAEAGLGDDA